VKLGVIEVGGLNLLKPRERERESMHGVWRENCQVIEHRGEKSYFRALNACAYFPAALLQKPDTWSLIVKISSV
jgi:hypothetical protein